LPERAVPTSPMKNEASRKIGLSPPMRDAKVAAQWPQGRAFFRLTGTWRPKQVAREAKRRNVSDA
jgi:hypothetical protein